MTIFCFDVFLSLVQVLCIVVDLHRFVADPDPDWHKKVPIHMRIIPQVLHILENGQIFLLFFTAMPVCNVFLFSSIATCHGFKYFRTAYWIFIKKKKYKGLELIPIRIRIRMPWMPMPIRIQNRQNYADPTRSESTTLVLCLLTCLLVKSSPMAQVGPLREHPLRVAPRCWSWTSYFWMICRVPELVCLLVPFLNIWKSGRSGFCELYNFLTGASFFYF